MANIRLYRPGDEDAAYYVCLKTGNHGDDGEHLFQEDPHALGRIYVGPYLKFEPKLSLILEDDHGVCGYALGACDSRKFYERYEREWRPELCRAFPAPREADRQRWSHVEAVHYLYHHPDYFVPPPYETYQAHVHIDLLARAQGQGYGKRLMNLLIDKIRASGAPGVHLGMAASNERAYRFYTALGFKELVRQGEGEQESIYMGMRLN